jgi:hypothetical protein
MGKLEGKTTDWMHRCKRRQPGQSSVDREHRLERRESHWVLQSCQTEFFKVLRRLCMVWKSLPEVRTCVATSMRKKIEMSWNAGSA